MCVPVVGVHGYVQCTRRCPHCHMRVLRTGLRTGVCMCAFRHVLLCMCEAVSFLNTPGSVCWSAVCFRLGLCVSLISDSTSPGGPDSFHPPASADEYFITCFCHGVRQLSREKPEHDTLRGGRDGVSDVRAPESKSPLRRGPRRAHRCCLLVSLGTDESASSPLSPDSVPSK